jgi:uncharacterized tannase-like protein DUF6351
MPDGFSGEAVLVPDSRDLLQRAAQFARVGITGREVIMGTRRRVGLLSVAATILLTVWPVAGMTQGLASGESGIRMETLSTPADRVSGGDALVEIDTIGTAVGLPRGPIDLNGQDISAVFHPGSTAGSLIGLVTGLKIGRNTLTAHGPGQSEQTLTITNYPIAGPISSGRHITPFICQTGDFHLPDGSLYSASLDADCSGPTKITYLYMPIGGQALVPLPSTTVLPADVATTTTTTGAVVKFVVRMETGTIDRGIYESAVLHDPTSDSEPSPFTPPKGWNHRLIAVEGFGCPGGWYVQGSAIGSLSFGGLDFSLLSPARLGEGYGLFSNTLMHPSNNCNAVLSGEAAMMSKEHFIETYGVPRYTVSAGCSGGSYGSIQLADALPGLFDGVLIACTFPDPLSIALSGSDGRLLTHYFMVTNPTEFTAAQQVAISGYKGTTAFIDAARQSGRTDPVPGRVDSIPGYVSAPFNPAVPVSLRYDPITNPQGARGTVYDAARNVYGVDPITGFALRPFDNVGIQYGLDALKAGTITPQQFLDLNQSVGGYDQDANYVASRTTGDLAAIRRAFEGGLEFSGSGGVGSIPVFDISGIYNDDSGYHYQWFHFATRDRIAEANGNANNEVMWRGSVPFNDAWSTFIAWVERVAGDPSPKRPREKVIDDRPADAVDGCWRTATDFIAEPQTFSSAPNSNCNALFPSFAFPRFVAGGPLAADVLKCQLKPIQPADYPSFTDADFARLKTIFPSGVCDWSKAGVGQATVVPWASFGPAPENLVFDITKSPQW